MFMGGFGNFIPTVKSALLSYYLSQVLLEYHCYWFFYLWCKILIRQFVRVNDTDVSENWNEKCMNACIRSQKIESVNSKIAPNFRNIVFCCFCPSKNCIKYHTKNNNIIVHWKLKVHNTIYKAAIWSSQKHKKSALNDILRN